MAQPSPIVEILSGWLLLPEGAVPITVIVIGGNEEAACVDGRPPSDDSRDGDITRPREGRND
jgi:hypothetical protein